MASSAINIKGTTGKDALRNVLSNAAFANWPRGSTFAITTSHSKNKIVRTTDSWNVRYVTDRDGTTADVLRVDKYFHPVGQVEVAGNNNFYLQMYNGEISDGTSAEHSISLMQRIPRVKTLQSNSAVLSFWARGSVVGQKIAVGFKQVFGGSGGEAQYDEFNQGATASYPFYVRGQEVTLSTNWNREEIRFEIPSILGKEIGNSGPNYLELSFYLQAGLTAARSKNLPAGISWGGETFDLANVQLEKGVNMSEFENIQGSSSFSGSVGGANIRAIASGQITHWADTIENAVAEVYQGVTQAGAGHGTAHYVNLNAIDPSTGGTGNNCLKFGSFAQNNAGKPIVIVSPSVSGQDTLDELFDVQTIAEPTTDRRIIKVTSFSKDNDGNSLNRLLNLYAMQLESVSSETNPGGGDPDPPGGGGEPPTGDTCEDLGCVTLPSGECDCPDDNEEVDIG